MKVFYKLVFVLLAVPCLAVTGDILSVSISGSVHQTISDAAISATSTALTSASCKFTADEVNSRAPINIAGAGASGAVLATYLTGYTDCNHVTVNDAAGTTVSGATAEWGLGTSGQFATIVIQGFSVGNNQTYYSFGPSGVGYGSIYSFGNLGVIPYQQSAATVVFNVTSSGYDSMGTLTTRTRASIGQPVYCTAPGRRAYPSSTTDLSGQYPTGSVVLDELLVGGNLQIRCSLSDPIYQGDSVTVNVASGFYKNGGTTPNNACNNCVTVTNGSTLAYSEIPPVCRWVDVPLQRVTAAFTIEAVCGQRYSNNGMPIPAIKFTCSDQHSNSYSTVVSRATISSLSSFYFDQFPVQVFAATVPITSFTDQDIIDCNFIAYPWIGDSTALLNSNAHTWPDVRLTDFPVFLDKGGIYGTPFVVVDPSGGGLASAATTYVNDSQSTIETDYSGNHAHSYTTIGWAVQAIKAFNNASHAHNDPGGGTILLVNATTPYAGTGPASDQGAMKTWVTIQPMSTVPTAQAILSNSSGPSGLNTQLVHIKNATLSDSTQILVFGNDTTSNVLWLDHNSMSLTNSLNIFNWALLYATGNYGTLSGPGFDFTGTTPLPTALVRGNLGTNAIAAQGNAFVGNKNLHPTYKVAGNSGGQAQTDDFVIAFNADMNDSTAGTIFGAMGASDVVTGGLLAENVFENTSLGGPLMSIHAGLTSSTGPYNNVLLVHNTTAGQRSNLCFLEENAIYSTMREWLMVGNVFSNLGEQADLQPGTPNPSGMRTGNWGCSFGVGQRGNWAQTCNSFPSFATADFYGMFTYAVAGGTAPGYVNDASRGCGSAAGNGDYRPKSNAPIVGVVPRSYEMFSYDLNGHVRDFAWQSVGAFELEGRTRVFGF